MKLKNKYYTYPVIDTFNNFYTNSSYCTDADISYDGTNVKLILTAKLVNPELEQLLKNGKIQFVHHIECPSTCYRKIVNSQNDMKELIISDKDISGELEICGFLIACQKLDKYENSLFIDELKGFKFDIDKGCVLAVGNAINFHIKKSRDDLSNTSSIFSISRNIDPKITEMIFDITDEKIIIKLPDETYSIYANMSENYLMQPVMHSILILPALQHLLYELKLKNEEQLYEAEESRWFKSLKIAFKKMKIEFNREYINKMNPVEMAQLLIGSPITNAVMYLGKGNVDED